MREDDEVTSPFVQVQTAVADEAEAALVADALVGERLAACVQQVPGVRSTFRWDGQVRHATEVLLVIKTTAAAFDALAARVRELHSYDVPEIVATPLEHVEREYADWLRTAVDARPTTHLEIERKFSLANATLPPDPADWPGVSVVAGERRFHLVATYFDTDDVALASRGITMRRRVGGTDAGWHLKLPRSEDAREEIWLPLDATEGEETVPDAFAAHLTDVLGERAAHPVCVVETRRTEWDLRAGGVHLATTCDDYVTTHNLIDAGLDREWHEMEVELVHGGTDFLDDVTAYLEERGVHQASIASKLRAAMGTLMDRAPT
ncbi:divalent cation tolerance protein CutA [Allobranchiibius sp. CTAmp26]|nr:divalent cation tolerance protein CutA [Allobranchiibius sp. CTAmp26]